MDAAVVIERAYGVPAGGDKNPSRIREPCASVLLDSK
jgi:hypothetical protein